MRHGLSSICSAALLGVGLVAPAQAQTRSGWVDPPARTEPAPNTPGTDKPEFKPEAPPAPTASAPPETVSKPVRSGMATPQRSPSPHLSEARPSANPRSARLHRRFAEPMASGAADTRFPDWAATSQRLTNAYLDTVSASGDGMVRAAPRFYGEQVRFHGRTLSLAAVMAEKRRFARRWPERHYASQDGTGHTTCSAATATCIVRTTFNFRADNPARGARSQGVSELVLTVSFAGEQPRIVAESSRVLRRYGPGPLSAIAGSARGV